MAWMPTLLEFIDDCSDENFSSKLVEYLHSGSDVNSIVTVVAAAAAEDRGTAERLHGCVQGFFQNVVSTYSPDTFRSHFRMTRSSFEASVLAVSVTVQLCN